ncbi:MAG TPA: TlpA disulfide reductase family protein [Longimicrobium sp.]|nr:TlpA disulfide reductase family protein [Longimicrobium sp.]
MSERFNAERINRILPYAALTLAAVLVVVLGQDKRELIGKVEDLQVKYREAVTQPRPGMFMPAFQTTTLDGRPATVGQLPAEGKQVLFVYTTTCRYCKSTLPTWKRLAALLDTMRTPRVQVFGVSLDSLEATRKYSAENRLPYPTVSFPEDKLVQMYRAGTVPLTLVLDQEGRTVYSRVGEITQQAAFDSIVAAVKLKPQPRPQPGQAPAAQAPAAERVATSSR